MKIFADRNKKLDQSIETLSDDSNLNQTLNDQKQNEELDKLQELTNNEVLEKTQNWFNYTLHFTYKLSKTILINHQSDFDKISSVYKPKYKNVFIVHGWLNSVKYDLWLNQTKEMIFESHRGRINLFIVDWSSLASNRYYYTSASSTKIIGRQLAEFIKFLKNHFLINMDHVHIIGHSLGAHIAGFTGKSLQESGIKIGKITALDPVFFFKFKF